MFKKLVKLLVIIIIACVVILLVGFASICVWASLGPRDISQYNSYIEKSIDGVLKDSHIKIGQTYIQWGGFTELLSIRANNVQLNNDSGVQIAAFPEIILKYGISSVVTGNLIPSRLKLVQPVINLTSIMHKENQDNSSLNFKDFDFSRLDELSIENGVLTAPDGGVWNMKEANLWYNDGDILISAEIGKKDGEGITASLRTNSDQSDSFIKASFVNFDTNNLVYFVPEIAKTHFIINGRASMTANEKVKKATFDLDDFTGEFDDADAMKYRLEVKNGSVSGSYDLNSKTLDITKLSTLFNDGYKMQGNAHIVDFKQYKADVSFSDMRMLELKKYWPIKAAPNIIGWVNAHLTGGIISTGTMKVDIDTTKSLAEQSPEAIDLKFNFVNVSGTYADKLMPVTEANGNAVMNTKSLKLDIPTAVTGGSKISAAKATISDIGGADELLTGSAQIDGPAEDLGDFYLKLVKGKKLINDKNDLSGTATTAVKLSLPPAHDVTVEQVEYDVSTHLRDASIKSFANKLDLDKVNADIAADNNSYSAKGTGLASSSDARLNLKGAPVQYEVASKGPNIRIAAVADLTNSGLQFAPLGLKKEAGDPAKLTAEVLGSSGQEPVLNQLTLQSKTINISGKGRINKDYTDFSMVDFDALKFGKTDLSAHIVFAPNLTAEFKGKYFDAAPVLSYLKTDRAEDNSEYKIFMQADEVGLYNGQSLQDVYATLHCAKSCDVISVNSQHLSFNQTSANLTVKSDRAGGLLKALDLYENMEGGKLEIKAKVEGSTYDGNITITDFSIMKAKALARMLSLGSLTGMADLVQGKGITFKKLSGDIVLDKHKVSIKDGRMVGAAIGVTAKGTVDRDNNAADISGNIIPAYTANTLLGNIPLIGDVIIGDDGVFALAYSMSGSIDDPKISVNPLSVLAPGFLKNVFQ